MPSKRRLLAALAAPVFSLALVAIAAAGNDPASQARDLLAALASSSAAVAGSASADAGPQTPALAAADAPIAKAKEALDRAQKLRAVNDVKRAELAEDIALEWAQAAHDLVTAVEAERAADEIGVSAVTATTKAERARTLLEEAIVRRARLQTALDELDKQLADKALDAGADAKAPKKKPVGGAP